MFHVKTEFVDSLFRFFDLTNRLYAFSRLIWEEGEKPLDSFDMKGFSFKFVLQISVWKKRVKKTWSAQ